VPTRPRRPPERGLQVCAPRRPGACGTGVFLVRTRPRRPPKRGLQVCAPRRPGACGTGDFLVPTRPRRPPERGLQVCAPRPSCVALCVVLLDLQDVLVAELDTRARRVPPHLRIRGRDRLDRAGRGLVERERSATPLRRERSDEPRMGSEVRHHGPQCKPRARRAPGETAEIFRESTRLAPLTRIPQGPLTWGQSCSRP
jgi:hypothetical protein